MIYCRLQPILDSHQSNDQFGFRAKCRIDDVFTILENLIGKTNKWNIPIWMASLDLRKAFDRIEFGPLFTALRGQNVPEHYVQLLAALYKNQTGSVNGNMHFPILRGVKQGDVISPMLFNAGLEMAFRSWKLKFKTHGFCFGAANLKFTNTRYADDIMLFAKSREELTEIIGIIDRRIGSNWFDTQWQQNQNSDERRNRLPLYRCCWRNGRNCR